MDSLPIVFTIQKKTKTTLFNFVAKGIHICGKYKIMVKHIQTVATFDVYDKIYRHF